MTTADRGIEAWVHGHSGTTQTSYGWRVERTGFYLLARAESATETWFHYSPPTLHKGGQTSLVSVIILLRTFGGASIESIEVFDGARQLVSERSLGYRSDKGAASSIDQKVDAFEPVSVILSSPLEFNGALGVSLLGVARQEADAIALSGVAAVLNHQDA